MASGVSAMTLARKSSSSGLRGLSGRVRKLKVEGRLLFARGVGTFIRERAWHASQEPRQRRDGTLEFRLQTSSRKELTRWILSWMDAALQGAGAGPTPGAAAATDASGIGWLRISPLASHGPTLRRRDVRYAALGDHLT
jgi:hypothetical protein